jgi:4-carboxymuconolactone decarboxylase
MPDEDDDERKRGQDTWREVMGFDAPPISDGYMELTVDHVFGRVWNRPGLDHRARRLISITAAATAGQREPLMIHISAALSSGDLTADELHEWVVQLAHYAGWPAGATAYGVLREVEAKQQT